MHLFRDMQNCVLRMRRECRERFPHQRGLAIPTSNDTWASGYLLPYVTQLYVRHFIQPNIKENIKAPEYWPFVQGIYRWPVDSLHKGTILRKTIPSIDVSMHTLVVVPTCASVVTCADTITELWRTSTNFRSWNTETSDSDSDSDIVCSTKIDTDTRSGLQKSHQYTIAIYSWYIMNLRHVERPPLRSYLTTGMGATRRGRVCTRCERIHIATFRWRGASHGGHHRDHHCGIFTIGETPESLWGPDICI